MSTEDNSILVESFGCKVSQIEARALSHALSASPEPSRGELVVVHTCSVTDRADRDARRRIRALRREHPLATLVVSGCLAQRDPEALAVMPEVDLVVGHSETHRLPDLLSSLELGLLPGKIAHAPPPGVARGHSFSRAPEQDSDLPAWSGLAAAVEPGRTRAFLKIQDGCERRCAFCVVPSLRGRERSAEPAAVEAEIRRLGEAGVPEVVLSGIHLATFGRDVGGSLLALLRRLSERPPRCRVRLSSVEPMEAGEALVELVARSPALAPHLHLPIQSGSDSVLRRMRRGLVAARFRRLAEKALSENPRLHLATDVIAGFPGETDAEHEETLALVHELPFASLHVFPFSPRSGTRGAELHASCPVPRAAVSERAAALRELGEEKRLAFERRNAGTLADTVVLRGGRGLTDNYIDAEVRASPPPAPGARLMARLSPGDGDGLVALVDFQAHAAANAEREAGESCLDTINGARSSTRRVPRTPSVAASSRS